MNQLKPNNQHSSITPQQDGLLTNLPAGMASHIIVNINGNTNINNYHHHNMIHGRKLDDQGIIRIGQNETSNTSFDQLQHMGLITREQRGQIKTMISKKLLNQAKKASKAEGYRTKPALKTTMNSQVNKQKDKKGKTQSQFDFNFNTSQNLRGSVNFANNVTIDFDKETRNLPTGTSNNLSNRRKSIASNQGTLTKSTHRVKPILKSSRPLSSAKQVNSLNKHKRNKSEIGTQPRTTRQQKATQRSLAKESIFTPHHNVSQERKASKSLHQGRDMSISSLESTSNRGGLDQSSRVQTSVNNEQIAQQLSKTYFLNTKQLLRHLSPGRIGEQPTQMTQPKTTTNQLSNPVRGRSRSIHNYTSVNQPETYKRSSSTSQPKAQVQQNLETMRNNPAMQSIKDPRDFSSEQRVSKSKSATLGAPPGPQGGNSSHKQAVDKLIQQNLKKNRTKFEEGLIKKQLEENRLKQRKVDINQRNQEVRQINASKIVDKSNINLMTTSNSLALNQQASAKDGDRRRAQSCIEYNKQKQTASVSERREHRSVERASVMPAAPEQTQMQKQVPQTTMNCKQVKPRSFVDEITKLTHQVERELGHGISKPLAKKPRLNETNVTDLKIATSSFLNASLTKKSKNNTMSLKVQKFIERKKREEVIKKTQQQTIEVEKQNKIQKNLNNLDRFVKKHLRQKSQPAIDKKKHSTPVGILDSTLRGMKSKRPKKHSVKPNDDELKNLQELFYPAYTLKDSMMLGQDGELSVLLDSRDRIQIPEAIAREKQRNTASQNSSLLIESALFTSNTAGRSTRAKKPKQTSANKKKPVKTASGSGVAVGSRKSSQVNTAKNPLNPGKQISVPLPQPLQEKPEKAAASKSSATQPNLHNLTDNRKGKKSPSKWLENRHPGQTKNKSMIPNDSDFTNPTLQVSNNNSAYAKRRGTAPPEMAGDQSSMRSPKSTGNIGRIQELVARYRCRFKQGISDAQIMGTLHSAASVIQIHFRYLKHLREAQKSKISYIESSGVDSLPQLNETAVQKKKKPSQTKQPKNKHVITEDLNYQDKQFALPSDLLAKPVEEKEVRGSVFTTSNFGTKTNSIVTSPPLHVNKLKEPISFEEKRRGQSITEVPQPKAAADKKRPLSLDIEAIEKDHNNRKQQTSALNNSQIEKSPLTGGQKTPQVPGLDLNKLHNKKHKEQAMKFPTSNEDPYAEPIKTQEESATTVSSYRGIFNRMGLPLPRSARVKVDYDLVEKDPKITEQLKEIVKLKEIKGQKVLEDGRREHLISERTYQVQRKKLEKWVSSSIRKIDSSKDNAAKMKIKTNQEMIEASNQASKMLQKKMQHLQNDMESGRQHSYMSQSWRAGNKGENSHPSYRAGSNRDNTFTDRDPYAANPNHNTSQGYNMTLGSARQQKSKLIELIQGESSRSSKPQENSKGSEEKHKASPKIDDVELQLDDIKVDMEPAPHQIDPLVYDGETKESPVTNEKSMNRSQSYPTIHKGIDKQSFEKLETDENVDDNNYGVDPSEIEIQLENALHNEIRKQEEHNSPNKRDRESEHSSNQLEDLRDPRFFMSKLEDESLGDTHGKSLQNELSEQKSQLRSDEKAAPAVDSVFSPSDMVNAAPNVFPNSPQSEGNNFEFFKIQTGAHSLSSTDSDMAKAIHAANATEGLDSPPDLISPKSKSHGPLLSVIDMKDENMQIADQMADFILATMLRQIQEEVPALIIRPQLVQHRQGPHIKFFEKKGIKTDLFAIEKYVDEIIEEVKQSRSEFMHEVNRPLNKNPLEGLFFMQNSEIGSYEHFQHVYPPVLSLDLYLKLEKRRKESRENPSRMMQDRPDGLFDFERVTEDELKEDGVNKNFLAECQHIHNKVLFDCINDSLQQFRPHGKEGAPMMWSTVARKLKPTEDFTLEEMFEITKHDLFRMAIMQAGTLPRREFVFSGHFDDELFAEIREKKLATLLCREIVETEPNWLKWDFEEAQTKIDIGDMVLEALVTEVIEFLNTKQAQSPQNVAQSNFEQIQQMLQSRSYD